MWVLDLDQDIESDMHRFHGVWVDLDKDEFGGLWAERLFSLIERLPAYDGAVTNRIMQIVRDEEGGGPSPAGWAQPQQLAPGLAAPPGALQVDSSAAGLRSNPDISGWLEVEQV